jgi:hypothetical protein
MLRHLFRFAGGSLSAAFSAEPGALRAGAGPSVYYIEETPAFTQTLEMGILDRLHAVQVRHPDLIIPNIQVYEEYGLTRSFRRGSTSEARAGKVDNRDVKLIN